MNTYSIPFDYHSIMIYGPDWASNTGTRFLPVITTLDPWNPYGTKVGPGEDATPNDYLRVCSLYDCDECMGRPFKRFTNGDCPRGKVPKGEGCDYREQDSSLFDYRCCQPADSQPPDPCPECERAHDCHGDLLVTNRTRWDWSCCGKNGARCHAQWCRSLDEDAIRKWGAQEVCTDKMDVDSGLDVDSPSCEYKAECVLARGAVEGKPEMNITCSLGCKPVSMWMWCEEIRLDPKKWWEYRGWVARGVCPVG